LANPYLGLLAAVGLQAWLLAAARPSRGRLVAAGLVLIGLVPLVALIGDLAGRFEAGVGIWHDLLLMLADGQIGMTLALLTSLMAGAGVAIVAVAGRGPARPEPEMTLKGEISVRRQAARRYEPEGENGAADAVEPEPGPEPAEPGPEPGESEPAQPEPERDPRLWSKPRGAISPPPGSRSLTPWPSVA